MCIFGHNMLLNFSGVKWTTVKNKCGNKTNPPKKAKTQAGKTDDDIIYKYWYG